MTSDELREIPLTCPARGFEETVRDTNIFLREIAAHLAQLNEGLASLTHPDGPQINTGTRRL